MILGIALCAFVLAYGRIGGLHLHHFAILFLAMMAFTFLTADQYPYPGYVQFAVNFIFYSLIFTAGALAGRWLDRDKYRDE